MYIYYQVTTNTMLFKTLVYFTKYFLLRSATGRIKSQLPPWLLCDPMLCDSCHLLKPIFYHFFFSILTIPMSNHTGLFIPQINKVNLYSGPLLLSFTFPGTIFYHGVVLHGAQINFMSLSQRVFPGQSIKSCPYSMIFSSLTSHYLKVCSWFVCVLISYLSPFSYQMGITTRAVTKSVCLWLSLLCLK